MFNLATRTTSRALTRQIQSSQTALGKAKIIYTETDEAPNLATYSLLPIIRRFSEPLGVDVEKSDISVAGRIISHWSDRLTPEQQIPDNLGALGELALKPEANTIKLPNVSASIPQLVEAIQELQGKGYNLPDFPESPSNAEEQDAYDRYAKVLGSAVNPVLREGNSDRRVAGPVKEHAQANPHRMMKPYLDTCRASVVSMDDNDFFANEQSAIMSSATSVTIEFTAADGTVTELKGATPLLEGEVADASVMRAGPLSAYFKTEIEQAAKDDILLSLHLKATMMKVSDPIMFGYCVKAFYDTVFEKHAATFDALGITPNNGIGDVYAKIGSLPADKQAEIEADIMATYERADRPDLAMVDSGKGITNLHVPSDVIIDASMPNVVRDGGAMWGWDDKLHDVRCMIPDRCYAGIYNASLAFCKKNGAFDPATMGNVANVGLMAQKAEEYGSHPNTFQMSGAGTVRVVDADKNVVFEHSVDTGDIFRMSTVKNDPVEDWVGLAVRRARATGSPAVFWLNEARAHDASIISLVNKYLPNHDTAGLDISIRTPEDAINFTMERAIKGEDTISVTGNVLRDYLTDLFPILELGTSAKMLSIVPLLNGGALFETGAGGSAPKHVQQFVKEGHLRWDSLGEFLALLSRSSTWPRPLAMPAPPCLATRSTMRLAACSSRTSPRHARSTRSTTAAATSTSLSTGHRPWPPRRRIPPSRPTSRSSPPTSRPTRRRSRRSLSTARAAASISAATFSPARSRRRPPCAPRPRSTPLSMAGKV
jgi:isocitrate dehydrogenase